MDKKEENMKNKKIKSLRKKKGQSKLKLKEKEN